MTFIRLGGRLLQSEHITSIKPCGENQCVVHCIGQSATDAGFLIDESESEVERKLNEARITEALEMLDAAEADLGTEISLPAEEPESGAEPEPEPEGPPVQISMDDRVWPRD